MNKLLAVLPETNHQFKQEVYEDKCIICGTVWQSTIDFASLEEAEFYLQTSAKIEPKYRDIVLSYFLEKEIKDE